MIYYCFSLLRVLENMDHCIRRMQPFTVKQHYHGTTQPMGSDSSIRQYSLLMNFWPVTGFFFSICSHIFKMHSAQPWSVVAVPLAHFMSFSYNMRSVNRFLKGFHFLNTHVLPKTEIFVLFTNVCTQRTRNIEYKKSLLLQLHQLKKKNSSKTANKKNDGWIIDTPLIPVLIKVLSITLTHIKVGLLALMLFGVEAEHRRSK